MAATGEKALNAALKSREFEPVYYFHGEDDFLKDAKVRELIATAVDASTRDFNLDVRRAGELDAESLDALLSTPPMLAERRTVIVRDVDKLKKEARKTLDRYLAKPASDTILVLVSPSGVKQDKGIAQKSTEVEFAPLTGNRVPKWVSYHAETLGRTITPEATNLLIEAVGEDLPQLAVELEKLASLTDSEINDKAVTDVVGVRRGESVGDFMDAVAARDTTQALALLPGVLQTPKMNAVLLVMNLTTQMLVIGYGAACLARGTSRGALYNEFTTLLRESGAFPGRPWGDALNAWTKNAASWSASEIDAALAALLATDEALKDSKVSSEAQVLTSLVLALCASQDAVAA